MSDWYPINRDEQERCAGILAHTHVALPLDVSQVSDVILGVVRAVNQNNHLTKDGPAFRQAKTLITALAAALTKES
jgi:hypothetical protein